MPLPFIGGFMPLYDYECGDCGMRFEESHSIHDTSVVSCPDCGAVAKKLVTSAVLHGLKKGPGAAYIGPVFEKPRPENDILYTAKKIEEGGKMTSQMEQAIKFKLDRVRRNPPKPVDYGKDGHPLDNH